MKAVFADTFYWVALTNIRDSAHEQARAMSRSFSSVVLVTTEAVIIEYLNYFAAWGQDFRNLVSGNAKRMLSDATVRVLPLTSGAFREGLDFYAARPDKGYSLTDCISITTMRREDLTDVLTNDRHFDQEGFRVLLRHSGSSTA